jgi:hypothetical protein
MGKGSKEHFSEEDKQMTNEHLKRHWLSEGNSRNWIHNELPLHLHWHSLLKRQILTSIGDDVENLGPSYTANWNVKWDSYFGENVQEVLQKVKQNCHTI